MCSHRHLRTHDAPQDRSRDRRQRRMFRPVAELIRELRGSTWPRHEQMNHRPSSTPSHLDCLRVCDEGPLADIVHTSSLLEARADAG